MPVDKCSEGGEIEWEFHTSSISVLLFNPANFKCFIAVKTRQDLNVAFSREQQCENGMSSSSSLCDVPQTHNDETEMICEKLDTSSVFTRLFSGKDFTVDNPHASFISYSECAYYRLCLLKMFTINIYL